MDSSCNSSRDRAGAAAAFDEARRLNQKKADVQASTFAVGVGRARARSGDLAGAVEQFERAVQLAPENFEAHYELAKAFTAMGRPDAGADASSRSASSCAAPTVPGSAMTARLLVVFAGIAAIVSAQAPASLGFAFTDVAQEAGLTALTTYGGQRTNKFLLETTGCGVAMLDYDNDGWLDLFFVNGTTLEGFPSGKEPASHLYRNRGNGTFEDVTVRAGLAITGWGQAACAGDYDNDGFEDLYVTFWGQNRLFRNRGNGTFEDVTDRAGLVTRTRWGAGCAFVDVDRDGLLDLFAANYIDFDLKTAPVPESGLCRYKGHSGCLRPARV